MTFPLWSTPAIAAIVWALWFLQRKFPLELEQPNAAIITDWKLVGIRLAAKPVIGPLTVGAGIMIINATGGGWIHLRSDGWWFLFSIVVVVLAFDLWGYILHRAQHKIPALWAMHSLHHSAEALSIITGARHFWLEDFIYASLFPIMGIIFKVPPEVLTIAALIYLVPDGLLTHLNVRWSFGRFALVINNPQYHRIHHSLEPQHFDKNFCRLFPLFDVIFGTVWKPGKDEFPKTGLAGEKATGFVDGFLWPVRHRLSWAGRSSGRAIATDPAGY
jgi:sterol desaturase/sphingolipid hydroxylase (fatty acid hydroxylase superfamily)